MRSILFLFGIACSACGEPQPEPYWLTEEFYDWRCEEKSDEYPVDKVIVSTETCDEGVIWLISELHFDTGQLWKQRLYKDSLSCQWTADFPLVEGDCDNVDGVTLTAWVNPATWSGALWGD